MELSVSILFIWWRSAGRLQIINIHSLDGRPWAGARRRGIEAVADSTVAAALERDEQQKYALLVDWWSLMGPHPLHNTFHITNLLQIHF